MNQYLNVCVREWIHLFLLLNGFSKSRPNLLHDFPDLLYDLWPFNDTIALVDNSDGKKYIWFLQIIILQIIIL